MPLSTQLVAAGWPDQKRQGSGHLTDSAVLVVGVERLAAITVVLAADGPERQERDVADLDDIRTPIRLLLLLVLILHETLPLEWGNRLPGGAVFPNVGTRTWYYERGTAFPVTMDRPSERNGYWPSSVTDGVSPSNVLSHISRAMVFVS